MIIDNSSVGRYRDWRSPNDLYLKIERKDSTHLYQWSYELKEWSLREPDYFTKPSNSRGAHIKSVHDVTCAPQQNYLQHIPWIFPKK